MLVNSFEHHLDKRSTFIIVINAGFVVFYRVFIKQMTKNISLFRAFDHLFSHSIGKLKF